MFDEVIYMIIFHGLLMYPMLALFTSNRKVYCWASNSLGVFTLSTHCMYVTQYGSLNTIGRS